VVLVTNEALSIVGLAQLYRDRADCENVFDEIKNQWGWAGFVTRDLKRCRILARLIALFYNWWNVFIRLAQPGRQGKEEPVVDDLILSRHREGRSKRGPSFWPATLPLQSPFTGSPHPLSAATDRPGRRDTDEGPNLS